MLKVHLTELNENKRIELFWNDSNTHCKSKGETRKQNKIIRKAGRVCYDNNRTPGSQPYSPSKVSILFNSIKLLNEMLSFEISFLLVLNYHLSLIFALQRSPLSNLHQRSNE